MLIQTFTTWLETAAVLGFVLSHALLLGYQMVMGYKMNWYSGTLDASGANIIEDVEKLEELL